MTQTNSQIREKIEEEFIEILEYGKNLKGEEVWTDSEKMHWLRKKIDELLKSQRDSLVEKLEEYKMNYNPIGDDINKGRRLACDDILYLIKNNNYGNQQKATKFNRERNR